MKVNQVPSDVLIPSFILLNEQIRIIFSMTTFWACFHCSQVKLLGTYRQTKMIRTITFNWWARFMPIPKISSRKGEFQWPFYNLNYRGYVYKKMDLSLACGRGEWVHILRWNELWAIFRNSWELLPPCPHTQNSVIKFMQTLMSLIKWNHSLIC